MSRTDMSEGVETHRLGTIALDGYHETRMDGSCDITLAPVMCTFLYMGTQR